MFFPRELKKKLRGSDESSLTVYKSGPATQAYLARARLEQGRNVVMVVPDQATLSEVTALTRLMTDMPPSTPFWDRPLVCFPPFVPGKMDSKLWARRWASLFTLGETTRPTITILTVDNLLPLWPSRDLLDQAYDFVIRGEELPQEDFLERAVSWGYERVSMVTRPGELSVRGDIVDIFAPGYEFPLRMELFGSTLESLRLFEPLSQRSMQEVDEAIILPVAPILFTSQSDKAAQEHWNHLWKTGALSKPARATLQQKVEDRNHDMWPGLYYSRVVPLTEWLPDDGVYLLIGAGQLRSVLEECAAGWESFFEAEEERNGWSWPEETIVQPASRARQAWLNREQVLFEQLPVGERHQGVELPEKRFTSFQDLFWKPEERKRPWTSLVERLKVWHRTSNQVVLTFGSDNSRRKFFKLVEGEDLTFRTTYQPDQKGLYALISDFDAGSELTWNHVSFLSENILQPRRDQAAARRSVRTDFKGLKRLEEINPDELLVHRDYGVGRFSGLTRLQVDKTGNDYLLILYAGGDKLYVPVDRLNLVQRYKGGDDASPALDRLGSTRWQTTKNKVRKVLEEIAHDLVQMYAFRKVAKGYEYAADEEMFREFEATFAFEETPDQEQAIEEVLKDLDQPEPMDRLVCGDAGFGKTEVALRAAFRAVSAGRQVAMLCPTTVLAEQHFQNFRQRLEDFNVEVEMVSRFVPAHKQKEVLRRVEKNQVDVLIGTHRLLSKDVVIPRLGLFILDEEQRFGVRHKEKLKSIRKNIDVLTLTATPIPRTLQLSLSGIRQLSVIETPPQERKAVESSLVERDPEMLKKVLERELNRGGQVFWVYNRVQGLPRIRDFVQALVPDARVGIAHGQLAEKKLEESMHQFWKGETDVLVCTAIIESGLDFPKANTLVVDQAQMFGLGQLYQLRGRVGRSSDQAFAYFVVPSVDNLPRSAAKRLQTILDMDYLGAGFQVAMEDLRLRGAGNILGEVQSGSMNKVGLDLFLEMLEQEVRRVRGEPLQQETDPELNITFEANIPSEYIADPQERLSYYRGLSGADSDSVINDWAGEMEDRFGPLPGPVQNFLAVLRLKRVLAQLQVQRADLFENRVVMSWAEEARPVDPDVLVSWVQDRQDRARFMPPNKMELRFASKESISRAIHHVGEELAEFAEEAGNEAEQQA